MMVKRWLFICKDGGNGDCDSPSLQHSWTLKPRQRVSLLFLLLFLTSQSIFGQAFSDTLAAPSRPFVRGGVYDKPFVANLFGKTAVGGYMEAVWKFERAQGVTEELTFEARRFNMFLHSGISERVRFFAELEFEHGTEEIAVEFAALDFEIHPSCIFRGGILLSPLGKFNLTHDSPLNEFTDRPLVSTQIIPTALSEAGMGFFGSFYPSAESRLTYELYGVNGFNDDILLASEGTRIRQGRGTLDEDNNHNPSVVGRLAYSPFFKVEVGVSLHTGVYNTHTAGDLTIDEKRYLTIAAFDWEYIGDNVDFLGEYALSSIDVPQSLRGLYAERQQGIYSQVNYRFGRGWFGTLPRSYWTAALRYEVVDFDRDLAGDAHQRLSAGVNFRPTSDTVFKLDYHYHWVWSRVNVVEKLAGIQFSVASYF
jgi:hypothetical protein